MMIRLIPYAALAIIFSSGAVAATNEAGPDAWAAEAFSEPCMNGDVPANGVWEGRPEQDARASRTSPPAA